MKVEDFKIKKQISRGAYGDGNIKLQIRSNSNRGGLVYLCNKVDDQSEELFAMKVVNKNHLSRKNLLAEILHEKDIMATSCNDFIVKLRYCLQVWKLRLFSQKYFQSFLPNFRSIFKEINV